MLNLSYNLQPDLPTNLLQAFLKHRQALTTRNQGWYDLPETAPIQEILEFAAAVKDKYEHIVVLGIGGSALGAIMLRDALKSISYHKLHVLDNIDPALIYELEQAIDISNTLFLVVTKSGSTPETIGQFHYFRNKPEVTANQFVFITSNLEGLNQGYKTFKIPDNVGGRFSVLTPVGLLPAALMGLDVEQLLAGAAGVRDQFFAETSENHPAYEFALTQYLLAEQQNVNMTVMMPYSSKLHTFADWYRQLLAESIGKAVNRDGKTVNVGITPIKALGITDQHSQSQLYTEGPKDKLILTIKVGEHHAEEAQQKIATDSAEFSYLNEITFKQLIDAEHQATIAALTKYKAPNATLAIPKVDEHTIGQLIMFFQLSVAMLGELYNIDAFNQPGVELGKRLTKEYLQK